VPTTPKPVARRRARVLGFACARLRAACLRGQVGVVASLHRLGQAAAGRVSTWLRPAARLAMGWASSRSAKRSRHTSSSVASSQYSGARFTACAWIMKNSACSRRVVQRGCRLASAREPSNYSWADDDMLTWDHLVARELPCAKCKGTFRVRGPIDSVGLSELRHLLETGQHISAIRLIRELSGADLRDAKGMYEHITIFRGRCRQCRGQLPSGTLNDCPQCRALNIDA
jgi:hypothetical protein